MTGRKVTEIKVNVGVIAQDVEKVLPEAVSTKPDSTKGVHYNKLISLLIESVRRQQSRT